MGDVRQHPAAIGAAGDQGLDSTTGHGRRVAWAWGLVDRHGHRLDSTGDGDVGDVRQHPAAIGAGDQGLDGTTGHRRGVTVAAGLVDRHGQRRRRAAWAWGLVDRHGHQLDSTGDGDVGDVRQHRAAIGTAGDQGLDSTTGRGAGSYPGR